MAGDLVFDYLNNDTGAGVNYDTLGNIDQLPAYLAPNPKDGVPQAPWYAPFVSAGAAVGIGFANKELYGSPGLNYSGGTPGYITLPGGVRAPTPGQQSGAFAVNTTTILMFVAIAGVVLLARR
jgi:hypothetical protein